VSRLLRRRSGQTLAALVGYAVLTVVMTWPLAPGAARDVPADLGDALLNMWIMAWDAESLVAMASGTMRFADVWHANIFHPSPLALTFSEHLMPQAVQGLPAYLATGNIVLAYNLVFLSTFALSGLGMFLLVRELTGSARAGFVAGLFYGFLPYRLGIFPHIQGLSSQWMPLALYGVRRYFDRGHVVALLGGTAAFVLQGLSSGYYLFYFAPVFGAYVLWEMAVRGRWRDGRTWIAVLGAAAFALACTMPFLMPYVEAKGVFGFSRPFEEVLSFSADLYAYINAPPQLYVWGPLLSRWPQPEGDLFMGAVPMALGLAAIGLWLAQSWRSTRGVAMARGVSSRVVRVLIVLSALAAAGAVGVALTGGFNVTVAGMPVRMTNIRRMLNYAVLLAAAAFWLSPRLRAAARARAADLTPFLVAGLVFSIVMSLGPVPRAGGVRLVGIGLYELFFSRVPGYDGLRAPARFAMVAAVMLAPLAGYALAALARRGRLGQAAVAGLGVVFLVEAYAVPMPTNLNWSTNASYATPWPSVARLNDGPLAYRQLLTMPDDTVVLELPFGDPAWDLRFVYYAGLHGKRIVNGYSGYFPDGYRARTAALSALWSDRDTAWAALTSAGATHILVHEQAYRPPEGPAISGWIGNMGARRIADFADGDVLFALPAVSAKP
jgi:hypothetical protein